MSSVLIASKGVQKADVDFTKNSATVTFDPKMVDVATLLKSINEKTQFRASPKKE